MASLTKVTPYYEWVKKVDQHKYCVGITHSAQLKLKEIIFVQLPKLGEHFKLDEACGFIESQKNVIDILMPLTGVVVHQNLSLMNHPGIINESPYHSGWLFMIESNDDKTWEQLDEFNEDIE